MGVIITAIAVFFIFLVSERLLLQYARKRFALVIHVNGTRGKSTVTRMIHALLRGLDFEAFGKTTGSAARMLLPDGAEKPVQRFGPANVREQRNMMLRFAFTGSNKKKALVFECNAIREELQDVSAKWLKPDISVITNVREDHVLELGGPLEAAESFARAVPQNSVLVTSDRQYLDVWEAAAKKKNLHLLFVDPAEAGGAGSGGNEIAGFTANRAAGVDAAGHEAVSSSTAACDSAAGSRASFTAGASHGTAVTTGAAADSAAATAGAAADFPENIACALGVADRLGITRDFALKSISEYKHDAGAFRIFTRNTGGAPVYFADARAANDIESSGRLFSAALKAVKGEKNAKRILLLVSRGDRPDRTRRFMDYIFKLNESSSFDKYLFLGHIPVFPRRKLKEKGINYAILHNINDLEAELGGTEPVYIFAAGNYGGKGALITEWLENNFNGGHE